MDQPTASHDASAPKKAHRATKPRVIDPSAFAFNLNDAAAMTGLSVATIRRREKDGMIEFVRVGGRTLVKGDSLRRMVGAAE